MSTKRVARVAVLFALDEIFPLGRCGDDWRRWGVGAKVIIRSLLS